MTTHGKSRHNLFSPRLMFHDDDLKSGHVETSPMRQTGRSSDELLRSAPAHLAVRATSERSRPASVHIPSQALPAMEHHFLTQRRQRARSTDKPLPPEPIESQQASSHEAKGTLTNRHLNLNMGVGRGGSKSPGKPSEKLQISAPFDPRKAISSSANPFDAYDQSFVPMSHQEKVRPRYGLLEDPDPQVTALPTKVRDLKPTIPRSSSAFSFGSSLIYVGSSLGNVFKFGSLLKKSSSGRAKKGVEDTSEDPSGRQRLLDTSYAGSPLFKAHSSDDARDAISDHQVREVIQGSPQLQKFFFGTKLYDESKSGKEKSQYRPTNPVESPTKTRRSMYNLGRETDDVASLGNGKDVPNGLGLWQRGLGITSQEYPSAQPSHEPIYQYADRVKPRLITIPPRTPSRPATAPHGSEQEHLQSNLLEVSGSDSKSAQKKFDENISGLHQHPNVNEFAVGPAWYEEERKKTKQLEEANNISLTRRLLARDQSRRHEILIPDEYHLWQDSRSANSNPIPSINVTRVGSPPKRSSTDAELTEESPMKMRKNLVEGFGENMMVGLELMTALDEIHGGQQEEGKVCGRSKGSVTRRGRSQSRDSIDTLVSEAEDMNLTEPQVPHRHPGRLLGTGRFRRLSMPLSMDNKSETHIPHINFSTPWPARGRRGGYRTVDEVPPTMPPHNTPVQLPTPQFPRDHMRIIGQELQEDDGEGLRRYGGGSLGLGLAE